MPSQYDVELKNYPTSTAGAIASNGTTEVAVLAAPGGGKRLRIRSMQLSTLAAGAQDTVILRNGASGATFYKVLIGPSTAAPTYAARDLDFGDAGFVLSANAALMASIVTGTTGILIGASAAIEVV